MKYRIDLPRVGRFFSVPCSAVDKYIKTADADYFKVLMCLLCADSDIADEQEIAERCGFKNISTAADGIIFWKNCGVISAETVGESAPKQAEPTSAPIMPKQETPAAPVCVTDAVNPMKNTAAAKSIMRYSNKEIMEKVKKNAELKTLFDQAEHIFGRLINGSETAGLLNLYEYYGYDVPSILMLIDFCVSIGKPRIAYIETVAKDWFSRGICTYAQVESEIAEQEKQHDVNVRFARVLGIEGKLTKKQEEMFAEWNSWGFSTNMVDLAGERCRENKNKTDVRYINGILKRWKESGIATPEDVERQEIARRRQIEQEKPSYDLDRWQQMADNFDPNTLGFEEDDDI